jgi:hypothetical protein
MGTFPGAHRNLDACQGSYVMVIQWKLNGSNTKGVLVYWNVRGLDHIAKFRWELGSAYEGSYVLKAVFRAHGLAAPKFDTWLEPHASPI